MLLYIPDIPSLYMMYGLLTTETWAPTKWLSKPWKLQASNPHSNSHGLRLKSHSYP